MNLRGMIEVAESCVTTATLPEQAALLDRIGKQGKLVALLRRLPENTRRQIHEVLLYDALPFPPTAQITPVSGGNESVAWHVRPQSGQELMCKIDRCEIASLRGRTSFSNKVADNRYIGSLYGTLALQTSLVVLRQPYYFGGAALARIQPFIPSSRDIFEVQPEALDLDDTTGFIEATRHAIANERIPDLLGHGNVVCDTDGHIRIVDTTITRRPSGEAGDRWDQSIEKFSLFVAKAAAVQTQISSA